MNELERYYKLSKAIMDLGLTLKFNCDRGRATVVFHGTVELEGFYNLESLERWVDGYEAASHMILGDKE